MIIKFCDPDTNAIIIQEFYRISAVPTKTDSGTVWVIQIQSTDFMSRIDIATPSFTRCMELMNNVYTYKELDISGMNDVSVSILDFSSIITTMYHKSGTDEDEDGDCDFDIFTFLQGDEPDDTCFE